MTLSRLNLLPRLHYHNQIHFGDSRQISFPLPNIFKRIRVKWLNGHRGLVVWVSFAFLVALRDGGTRLNNEDWTLLAKPRGTINLMLESALSSVSCQWPASSSLISAALSNERSVGEARITSVSFRQPDESLIIIHWGLCLMQTCDLVIPSGFDIPYEWMPSRL